MDGVNEDAVRRMMEADSVPDFLLDQDTIRPLSERAHTAPLTYDDMMALMEKVYEQGANPYGDRIEMARWPDETRAEAKRRLMREVYAADMRAKYHMPPKEFVQTDGKPYHTDNWAHFFNRYSAGACVPSYRIGVYKDTPAEMMRHEARENGARYALRILGH